MSQSPSLIAALEAVDRVLSAETGDLKQLADIAGLAPEVLYLRADLTGVDLRHQDIDFLLPLEVDYVGAILTDQQFRAFRNSERQLKRRRVTKAEQDVRLEMVNLFIADFVESGEKLVSLLRSGHALNAETLREILASPLSEYNRRDQLLPASYTNSVLEQLSEWGSNTKSAFFPKLFALLSGINCVVDERTPTVLHAGWRAAFGEELGNLIAAFHLTEELDTYWVLRDSFDDVMAAATQIGMRRAVHAKALERAVRYSTKQSDWTWREYLGFLTDIPFDCDNDLAERLSVSLTKKDWPARNTLEILEAKTHPKIRTALFRQLLGQGKEERVIEVIKWLDDNRGAAGALSLENAFGHIKNFDLAFRLANDLAPRLADNQLNVVASSLSKLVYAKQDNERVESFRRRFLTQKSGRRDRQRRI